MILGSFSKVKVGSTKRLKKELYIIEIMVKKFVFLAMFLFVGVSAYCQDKAVVKGSVIETKTYFIGETSFKMIALDGGAFLMGSQELDRKAPNFDAKSEIDEHPVHKVTLSPYAIGETEVTQALWTAVGMHTNIFSDEYGIGDNYPAYNLSYDVALIFIDSLNSKLHGNGQLPEDLMFSLPTEAQWEYAARGGKDSRWTLFSGSSVPNDVAWFRDEEEGLQPVKTKRPNELGIYDMSGNVYEWCYDKYDPFYFKVSEDAVDPKGPDAGSLRSMRGGSWYYEAPLCRVTNRYASLPSFGSADCGMRVALVRAK